MLQQISKYCQSLLVLAVSFASVASAAYSPSLENHSSVGKLLRRLDAQQQRGLNLYLQPLKYSTINDYLSNVIDTMVLSSTESSHLLALQKMIDPTRGIIKWSDEKRDIHLRVHLSLLGDSRLSFGDDASIGAKGIIHPMLTGNLGKLSFFSGIDVWTEYRSDTVYHNSSYQPYEGIPYNLYGRSTDSASVRSSDIPRGGISYDGGSVKLEAAIDYLKCGPAVYYPLTLSGMAPPITYLKADLDLGVITYSHAAGLLRAQKDRSKFIYFHRLGAPLLHGKLHLGINEVIINGSSIDQNLGDSNRVRPEGENQMRSWEIAYLIPFVPFKFVEHYAGDRDNAAISFDLTFRHPQGFRWYGEFFLDDVLAPWKVFTNDWGNKWALTCGMQYYGTLKGRDIQVELEYSRVEPWVYTHFYGGSHRYTNFNKPLGSPLGPNSQALIALFEMTLHPLHEAGIGITYNAKNPSVRGGTITDVFQYPDIADSTRFYDSETKLFLGKGTKSSFGPLATYVFNPFGKFQINVQYELDLVGNPGMSKIMINGGLVL